MRFRNMLMLTAVVSVSVAFALGCSAGQASQSLYAQNQGEAPTGGQVQGENPAPAQGQSQGQQVNDRVRELQEQYKDLLKHEYNPSQFHPKATGEPSFSKPGWLNHASRRSAKKVSRSHARHSYYGKRSSKHGRKSGGKSALRRYSKKGTRTHAASRRRSARSRKAATRGSHKRSRAVASKRAGSKRAVSARNSAAGKSRPLHATSMIGASNRRSGRTVRTSAKKPTKGSRSTRAAHGRKGLVKKSAGGRKARRNPGKSHRTEKKHKK